MKSTGYIKVMNKWGDRSEIIVYDKMAPTVEGRLAIRLLEHFAIVAAAPDGVDEAGRQKLRLLTPSEAATRACETAQAMYEVLHFKEWLLDLPGLELVKSEEPPPQPPPAAAA